MSAATLSRTAFAAGVLSLIVVLGCTALSGRRGPVFEQKGQFTIAAGEEKDIPFPKSFASAPEVELGDTWLSDVKIVECKPDHIRVRNLQYQILQVTWTAKGERPAAPPAPEK